MAGVIQPSLAKGEISPSLHGRVDTAAYQVAVKTGRNITFHKHGGGSKRPGLMFVAPAKRHDVDPRLIRFQFKTTDAYVLEFGELYMRVIRGDGHVLETAKTITGITQANPAVVTTDLPHGFANGEEIFVDGVAGMTRVNGRRFLMSGVTANTFQLAEQAGGTPVDSSGFAAYTSGGTAARVYEIATPYALADLAELSVVQSADVMTLTHPDYPTKELSRTAHNAWTLTEPTFAPDIAGPTGISVTPDAPGAVEVAYTVTAVKRITAEESLRGLETTGQTITGATNADPVVITSAAHGYANDAEIYIDSVVGMTELNGRVFTIGNETANTYELLGEDGTGHGAYGSGGTTRRTFATIATGATPAANTIAWTAVADAQKYYIYKRQGGVFGLIAETTATTYHDAALTPDVSSTPPAAYNPFRLADDYPGTCGYFEQRRVFGGSRNRPDTSFYSQVGNHSNFTRSSPAAADDAFEATLNAQEVNEIRHFVPGNDLIVFTAGTEWRINSGTDSAFSIESIKQKPQSAWGASHQKPIVIGPTILYVQDNRASIRSLGYSLSNDGYVGSDMTLLADHLFGAFEDREIVQITDWAYGKAPDSLVYVVRSDGQLALLTFEQEQEVLAWSRWDTRGEFKAVAVIRPSSDDIDDAAYFVVKRTINGETVRYIERTVSPRFTDVRDCFFVDCGVTLDEPTTITGVSLTNPVVLTVPGHTFVNGDEVDIADIVWDVEPDDDGNADQPDQLNGNRYTVSGAAAGTIELSGVDGTDFVARVKGGAVRKAVTAISGLDHLEGASVVALADGGVVSGLTVEDGAITLPAKASRVHVGLRYIADIETLNIEAPQGTIQGKLKKVNKVVVRLKKSRAILIGPDAYNLTEMKLRQSESMGDPTALITGDYEVVLTGQWNTNGRIFLRQREPLPMTVLAVVPDITVGS